MIKLPNDKICYNLPEQVGVNAENIKYLAETYQNLDEQVATWPTYKAEWDQFEIDYANWTSTLDGYLASMSSAAVSAIAGQDIAPKTVSQTNYNYSLSFNLVTVANIDITNIYNRFCSLNNILYIIVNVKLTNNSGSSTTFTKNSFLAYYPAIALPSDIGSKIVDITGKTVAEAATADNTFISIEPASTSKGDTAGSDIFAANLMFYNKSTVDRCGVGIYAGESITLPDGASLNIYGRIALTLL